MEQQVQHDFVNNLPLVLAGPMLHQTTPDAVTVWVALKQACHVSLTVLETNRQGREIGRGILQGERTTIALGQSLHVVAVTARSNQGERLGCDRLYAYDLQFLPLGDASASQSLQQALCSRRFETVTLSYFAHHYPTFVLTPNHPQDLRLVHGSCRRPHGDGFDALPILDSLIEEAADQPRQRPHLLFLTGDQIYGDDVADPMLWVATRLGNALLGWQEQLPLGPPDDVNYCTPEQLPAGGRAEIATQTAGFTAGLRHKRAKTTSHLFSLGEYYASYLLAWSPVCWPETIPAGCEMGRDRKTIRQWDREARDMRQFVHTLWKVRRALANIPVYTIFDDHDVSDDWNLNQAWCLRVLGRPLGRRVVQNALLAYAAFQGWGNTPEQFESGKPGAALLAAAADWSTSQGTDASAGEAIARYLGLPSTDPSTHLPRFVQDGPVLVLDRHPEALTWHFTVHTTCCDVVVLDTRTWRGYPADQKPIAPPMLLCPQAFEQQLIQPLQQAASARSDSERLTFIIAPTNVFGLKVIDWIHHWQLRQNKVFSTDVGDAWNIHTQALAQLLVTLFAQRRQLIVLSGDIHYSSMVRLSSASVHSTEAPSVLLQLTCSALKNEETLTHIIHTRLKDWLLPEKVRRWQGWTTPPEMVERPVKPEMRDRLPPTPPDWICTLEWIPRLRSQVPSFGSEVPWLKPTWKRARDRRWRWLRPFMAWKYQWVQDGREVVGRNNLALVQFEKPNEAQPYTVIQDLYWFSSWAPTQLVYSRFASPLVANQTLLDQS